jgi:hypothetical protein
MQGPLTTTTARTSVMPSPEPARSRQLNLDRYDTDKVPNSYFDTYDAILQPWLNQQIVLLELGIWRGGSLLYWRDYFPFGTIVGIDLQLPKAFEPGERICMFQGSQSDRRFLSEVSKQAAPQGFDIIIDDASHIGELTRISFWHLFDNHLKPGGLYVIEDWGTGYWDDWPDGKRIKNHSVLSELRKQPLWTRIARKLHTKTASPCHSHGMVGLVKELVDEQGAFSVTMGRRNGQATRASKFRSLLVLPSMVVVTKAVGPNVISRESGHPKESS